MKTSQTLLVNYLRIYPVAKERTSAVSKTKSLKVAGMIFDQPLPASEGQEASVVIELTAKQLDNLCTIANVRGQGEQRWYDFSVLIGTLESVAHVTSTSHKKDDTYIDGNNNEQKYLQDSTNTQIDSIVLPKDVRVEFKARAIERVMNYKEEADDLIGKLLNKEATAEPALDGVK